MNSAGQGYPGNPYGEPYRFEYGYPSVAEEETDEIIHFDGDIVKGAKKVIHHKCSCGKVIKITIEEVGE